MISVRSLHNIRIECLWRDVRKDSLEAFRRVFQDLESQGLLDMDNQVQCIALFLVYHQRIQVSLNHTCNAWNNHKIRTAGNQSPLVLWELSRLQAQQLGYWTGDPGDEVEMASDPFYGCDGDAPLPPQEELNDEINYAASQHRLDEEEIVEGARNILVEGGVPYDKEDGNWGINTYLEAVKVLEAAIHS